ncbi:MULTISPECIES: hypothetical protein [Microbacterium]|jgi:heme/copper-type cytochrome/quinol oxidase subunit 2|uniref:hypothetical protein n=1 Tax=Microbacterium TaxID=33882 RepID=UPI001E444E49|nr:hypothetical protein [Microbacterium nymphoidis]MCD2497245.1 hypothetical protein [Microbacterium nymphoidis]MDR2294144.1 hypothetical protein [Microbacterium sp.]
MSLSTLVVAAAEEHAENVMLHTFPAALIAACVFFLLAMVTLSYRNVANRHAEKAAKFAHENPESGHGAGHGAGH